MTAEQLWVPGIERQCVGEVLLRFLEPSGGGEEGAEVLECGEPVGSDLDEPAEVGLLRSAPFSARITGRRALCSRAVTESGAAASARSAASSTSLGSSERTPSCSMTRAPVRVSRARPCSMKLQAWF